MLKEVASNKKPELDSWQIYDCELNSRFIIGSAMYPSPETLKAAVQNSRSEIITVSLRRQSPEQQGGNQFWKLVQDLGIKILPNTAGCHSVKEAVTLAEMSRELFSTNWIKLEVIGDEYNLQPDPINLIKAAEQLVNSGFNVFPYCTDDLVLCKSLYELGCEVVMPWGSPIGTGQGLMNPYSLQTIRERLPNAILIVDAGIGKPSHACQAMEMGFDGILLNTAVAKAVDPVKMAGAFRDAINSGRSAYLAGTMPQRQTASPSTPITGTPFWHQVRE